MFELFVSFVGGDLVPNPRPCPHVTAYARELGYQQPKSSEPLWPLPRHTHAQAITKKIAGLSAKFPDPARGVLMLDLEISAKWRAAGATGQQISEELDWLAATARYMLRRDVAYVGPEDSPYCRFRGPMMYYPNGWRAAPLVASTKPIIPYIWNHTATKTPRPLTADETKALATELVTLNGAVGLQEGVIAWSYDKTAKAQQAYLAWVEGFYALCAEASMRAELEAARAELAALKAEQDAMRVELDSAKMQLAAAA